MAKMIVGMDSAKVGDVLTWCRQRWSLRIGDPFTGGRVSYVAPVTAGHGTRAVLKVTPSPEAARSEARALRLFEGRGAVRLLDAEIGRGALLLERLVPGTPLGGRDAEADGEATAASIVVLRMLPRQLPAGHGWPLLRDRAVDLARTFLSRFETAGRPFNRGLALDGAALWADLGRSSGEAVALHGDLHRGNVLAGRGTWVGVDPSPLAGDRAYDAGAILRDDPESVLGAASPNRMLRRRLDQAADELELDRERVKGWGLAQLVAHALERFETGDRRKGELFSACAKAVSKL